MQCRALLLCALLLAAAGRGEAAPLPAQQAALERAVITYEQGHLAQARAAFERLARQGVPAAQYNLAVMHLRREMPAPSVRTASRLLHQAAEGGFVTAQFMLGQALENGQLGPRDLPGAMDWYERAAESGSTEAKVALGTAYYLGRGRPKEPALAARWYREAAAAGDIGAQYLLASMYEQGDGVERDLRLARYWYDVAARNGDPAAPGKVKELDGRMAEPAS